jgi:hypothetical protein
MSNYPRVRSVQALPAKRLRVTFENGEVKLYDCTPLLDEPAFQPLRDEAFFRNVSPDRHGYAVIWNDAVDLAEAELWLHGTPEPNVTVGPR